MKICIYKKENNKAGYATITAIGYSFLLMSMGLALLLTASYRYQVMQSRNVANQTYLYAIAMTEQITNNIKVGALNEFLTTAMDQSVRTNSPTAIPAAYDKYGKVYNLDIVTSSAVTGIGGNIEPDANIASNPTLRGITNEHIDNQTLKLEMKIQLKPGEKRVGKSLPTLITSVGGQPTSDYNHYLNMGDTMQIEYRYRYLDKEYVIKADYYCSKNANLNPDGTLDGVQVIEDMKWSVDKYTGKMHTIGE